MRGPVEKDKRFMKTERPLIAAVAVLACAATLAMSDMARLAAEEATGSAMLDRLMSGGYVVYLRHSMTDTSRNDADPIDIKDWSTQRPLSDAGRALARKIGEAFEAAHVPVGSVVSSPYCRAVETAVRCFPD
ncbi:MAG TPA: histidine phosphatase family protein [Stellaceae bacterium]|nr:histidine phosphatase family protein [Stellaceae bacterium]